MACELCGNKQAVAIVRVEGVEMQACNACASHGTFVKQIVQTQKTKASPLRAAPKEKSDDIVEQVRPETAALLRKYRERIGLTPEKFAAKLGIRLSTYHHYESGSALPDIPTARKLEHELKTGLVIKVKFSSPQPTAPKEEKRGLQLGDFLRK